MSLVDYKARRGFAINVGFKVECADILEAASLTNAVLSELPPGLYRSLDYKTVSSIVGSVYCDALASRTNGMVNPIEKGHPDIIPKSGAGATEAQLRNYPKGLEIKCTVGNIVTGANLRAGVGRIEKLTGVTWQAHHREVEQLMGLVWDFVNPKSGFNFPALTGVFYADNLEKDDWGEISGTTGRNTKVSGMRSSGKQKMGRGWVLVLNDSRHLDGYGRALGVDIGGV